MCAEEVYDLLRVFVFLGAQEAVAEDPVIGIAMLVFGAQEGYSGVHQFEHLKAAFDAFAVLHLIFILSPVAATPSTATFPSRPSWRTACCSMSRISNQTKKKSNRST